MANTPQAWTLAAAGVDACGSGGKICNKKLNMMKNIILGILITIFLFSCKDVRKEYYEDGALWAEMEYKNNVRNGKSIVYYPNGNIQQEGFYIDDKEEGLFKEYYETGELKREANLKNGVQDGVLKAYYKDGSLQTIQFFNNGLPDSTFKSFYSNGQLEMEASKEKGKTLWYIEYDSIGNWTDESRIIEIKHQDTILLGETITMEFNVNGPIEDTIFVSINTHFYEKPSLSSHPSQFYLKDNKYTYTFVPNMPGRWAYHGFLWVGDMKTKEREFKLDLSSFWVIEKEDRLVEK